MMRSMQALQTAGVFIVQIALCGRTMLQASSMPAVFGGQHSPRALSAVEMRDLLEEERGKWLLVQYSVRGMPATATRALYMDLLADRLQRSDFRVIDIVSAQATDLVAELGGASLSHPVWVDSESFLPDELQLPHRQDCILLIGPQGRVEFDRASQYIRDGDLRQLIEKALNGRVSRPTTNGRVLQAGDRFPGSPLAPIKPEWAGRASCNPSKAWRVS